MIKSEDIYGRNNHLGNAHTIMDRVANTKSNGADIWGENKKDTTAKARAQAAEIEQQWLVSNTPSSSVWEAEEQKEIPWQSAEDAEEDARIRAARNLIDWGDEWN